ncbi:glycosyltransferase [Streptomyces sp. Li-HN-5-11]|uniref:glycosyltransferase n=1 Tax=Streptomyces sp. Li-HN-5-11 TaxID=3075432 RepID=UPI0028B1667B|nr:glycosyltransferase [Streptomyces sp. Li-HN-5-11]WNM32600.1 glycosyltransferase [Streptomyces sp. Li-HN-5-11]
MSRFLFVVPPLVGHINPAAGVAAELAARGHRVAWAAVDPGLVRRLAGEEAVVFRCAGPVLGPGGAQRPADLRGPEALKFLWERFLGPLAEAMAPGVAAAVEDFGPDVVVADQQAFAGGLVAERLRVPWATSATTSAELAGVLDGLPGITAWMDALLGGLRARIGDPSGAADPRFSPRLTLAFSTPELVGPGARADDRIRWVGPSLTPRPAVPGFPWDWLDASRFVVLVTLGTANTDVGARFLGACLAAVRERTDRLQAVIVDPGGVLGASATHGAGPDDKDVLVLPSVPQLPLLERVDAVVCHAGHNTVCEALWHGVPLVVAPIRDDQPVVAGQVTDAGAGVRVRFGRVSAQRLGGALDSVLHDPAHRAAAERIRAAFRAAGGSSAAATHLERLAGGVPPEEEQ